MTITMIWAQASNGVIGKDNDLPWRLPRDMAYFKQQTQHKTVVMGRKTWESFGGKPLPNRRNIIITRSQEFTATDAEVVYSVEEAIQLAGQDNELMVIGGSTIYEQFLQYADRLLITKIDHDFAGDTYFPEVDWSQWQQASITKGIRDEKNDYDYRFEEYLHI
ncbi:dihydrofolate reductase [Paenibacillus sp. PK4536]|uniref:dihydrofolate reductase n=1 Tax=Paenibacillus sp. PK4536 TaxID=3024576 RepID=UPI002359A668|nr:dihydrofolate reductase [Paenibacillus sp. PK4536]WIM38528.1 dihydrofolate reductase [Paenibacillus sp. PK4536]